MWSRQSCPLAVVSSSSSVLQKWCPPVKVSSDSAVLCYWCPPVVVSSSSGLTVVGTGVLACNLKLVAAAQWFVLTLFLLILVDFKLSK